MNPLTVSPAIGTVSNTYNNRRFVAFKQNPNSVKPIVPPPVKSSERDMSRVVPIVSSAVAVASLALATYALVRKPNSIKNLESKMEGISSNVTERLTEAARKQEETLTNSINTLKNEATGMVNDLRGHVDGSINGIRSEVNNLSGVVKSPSVLPSGIFTRDVEVNGMHMQLGTVLHGYGVKEEALTNRLRSESTRRILGIVDPVKVPEDAVIRIPTAEFQGFAKTGGLATVPRELVANLGAVINNKQKAQLVVDTPLYLGQVENAAYFDIVRTGENSYNYVKTAGGKTTMLAEDMTLINRMEVPIYTDAAKTKETVEVFMSNEMRQAVSFDETLAQFEPAMAENIKAKLKAGQDVDTALVRFTAPRPSTTKIVLSEPKPNGKPNVIDVDFEKALEQLTPDEAQQIKSYHAIGKDYEMPIDRFVTNEGNQMKIFSNEHAGIISKDMDASRIAQEKARQDAIQSGHNPEEAVKKVKVPMIRFIAPQPPKAEVKFRTVFYKNDKFLMDGPIEPGKNKNIYTDKTTQAGETERNIYFCKYMYENLADGHRTSDKPQRADWIIGNDWHTGPLTAMIRLLTPAREAMGMEPTRAEKLYNTPITTLMHNFKLRGAKHDSQPKLLNVMFGEHTAKIAENAWMPQDRDLPGSLMNGLFHNNGLNPQTMAMSYADQIVFVSKGNFKEASTIGEKGGDNYMLASMRGRTYQYADKQRLGEIAMGYKIDPNKVPDYATAKGITNGSDRVNHIISQAKARHIEEALGMKVGSIISDDVAINNPYFAHQHNKHEYLTQKVIPDINKAKSTGGKENPMLIHDFEHTDLTGVDENTPVFVIAGRIVDQKGLDIDGKAILKFYQRGNFNPENPPVFYRQGTGESQFMDEFMKAKEEVRKICPKGADRMVYSELFSQEGRYDGAKMMSDFCGMPSWDEPCGLVHKEVGYTSGSISIVNEVGGLRDGLKNYVKGADAEANKGATSIFVPFKDKDNTKYEDALEYNSEETAKAYETAIEWFNNKPAFEQAVNDSYKSRFDWLLGKVQEYVEIGKRHGVIKDSVDSSYVA